MVWAGFRHAVSRLWSSANRRHYRAKSIAGFTAWRAELNEFLGDGSNTDWRIGDCAGLNPDAIQFKLYAQCFSIVATDCITGKLEPWNHSGDQRRIVVRVGAGETAVTAKGGAD